LLCVLLRVLFLNQVPAFIYINNRTQQFSHQKDFKA
jgi:hypothetical protein